MMHRKAMTARKPSMRGNEVVWDYFSPKNSKRRSQAFGEDPVGTKDGNPQGRARLGIHGSCFFARGNKLAKRKSVLSVAINLAPDIALFAVVNFKREPKS
jgi:hypothetical protein